MNIACITGRMTKEPELRYLAHGNGTAVVSFTLAVDKNLSKDKKAEMESKNQPTADFINCKAWGKTAETVANYLAKGRLVGITGRIETGSYEAKDGSRRYTTEIIVQNLDILEWGDKQDSNRTSQNTDAGRGLGDIDGFYTIDSDDIPF